MPDADTTGMDRGRPKLILFLDTRNDCHSRFAEILFNFHAAREGLAAWAISRGLAVHERRGAAPVRTAVVLALARRGLSLDGYRPPMQVRACELEAADRAVAIRTQKGPALAPVVQGASRRVEHWDLAEAGPAAESDPLAAVEICVRSLLRHLALEAALTAAARRPPLQARPPALPARWVTTVARGKPEAESIAVLARNRSLG